MALLDLATNRPHRASMIEPLYSRIAQVSPPFLENTPLTLPGASGADLPLYAAWKKNPRPTPLRTFFNVRVGPDLEQLTGGAGDSDLLAAQLSALRIDALTWDGSAWWIIEFHERAGLPQLGRLIAYPDLLRSTYGVDIPIQTLAVSRSVNFHLRPLFDKHGIPVLLYDLETGRSQLAAGSLELPSS